MNFDLLFSLFAPSGQNGGPGLGVFLFQMLAFIAIIYFLLIRPKVKQEREHKERLSQLKKGDEVVTVGGIVGQIVHIKDQRITLKSAESRVVVQRDRIADILGGAKED